MGRPIARRVCAKPGCPSLVDTTAYRGLCLTHQRERDQARGSRDQRGYGTAHQTERARLVALVDAGAPVTCWRCGEQINRSSDLHLGHDDTDRSVTRGPEHVLCNLSAAGQAAHRTL